MPQSGVSYKMTWKILGLVWQPLTTFHSMPFLTVHFCYTIYDVVSSLHPHCKLIAVGCISDWRIRFKARRPGDRVPSSRGELHFYQKWTRVPPPVLHEPNVWEILQAVLEENGPTSPRIRVTRRHKKAIKGQCREEVMVQFKELISMALGSR